MIDGEALLVQWLTTAFPTAKVRTETGPNLAGQLPTIRIGQVGGTDRDYKIDHPLFMVDVFHTDRPSAKAFAEQVRDSILLNLPGQHVGTGSVRATGTIRAPSWLAWDNTGIRRYSATYQLIITAY